MDSPPPSLWQTSASWRWLFAAALLFTALAFIGSPRKGKTIQYAVPSSQFDANRVAKPQQAITSAPLLYSETSQEKSPSRTASSPDATSASSTSSIGIATPPAQNLATSNKHANAGTATGQPALESPVNKIFDNEISVSGQRIPLPTGKWRGLAFFRAKANTAQGDSVLLGRIENGVATGIIAINASTVAGGKTGFPAFSGCNRTDYLHLTRQDNEAFGSQHCWWINHGASVWDQPLFRAGKTVLEEQGASAPTTLVNVAFRRASANGFATAFYYFNPEEAGISSQPLSWAESEWHRSRLSLDPRRVDYVKKLLTWGDAWASLFYAANSP